MKKFNLNNAKGGAAVTLVCKRHDTKKGWGKVTNEGNVEIFIPSDISEEDRDEMVISEFANKLNIKKQNIEIFSGKNDKMIVTILGVDSSVIDNLFVG